MTNRARPAADDMSYGMTGTGCRATVEEGGMLVLAAANIQDTASLARGGLLSDWASEQRIFLERVAFEVEPFFGYIDEEAALRHLLEALAAPIFIETLKDPREEEAVNALLEGRWAGAVPDVAAVLDGDVVAAALVDFLDGPFDTPADLDDAIERRSHDYWLVAAHQELLDT
jgi:hypothetical protein